MSASQPIEWTVAQLAQAVERGQLELHYQPIVDLRSEQIVGAEALLRWRHPTLGLLPPGQFLPVIESSGLMRKSAHGCWAQPAVKCATGGCWHGNRSGWPSMFRRAKWGQISTSG